MLLILYLLVAWAYEDWLLDEILHPIFYWVILPIGLIADFFINHGVWYDWEENQWDSGVYWTFTGEKIESNYAEGESPEKLIDNFYLSYPLVVVYGVVVILATLAAILYISSEGINITAYNLTFEISLILTLVLAPLFAAKALYEYEQIPEKVQEALDAARKRRSKFADTIPDSTEA